MDSDEKSLYEVLGVDKTASQADIKKAYHKLALKLHPDKNPGDEEASSKFQSLQRIYAVIGDPDRRKVYDQTGSLEDSEGLAGEKFEDLYQYYRNIYKRVSEEDIEGVAAEYRGSQEEKEDVFKYYQQFKGNMDKVFEWVMCSEAKLDSHRFMDAVEAGIAQGELKRFKAFTSWAKETAAKPRPKDPLAPKKKRKKKAGAAVDDEQALVAAIRGRAGGSGMGALAAALEAKYGTAGAGEDAAGGFQEPSEEEFQATAARLKERKQGAAAGNKENGRANKKRKAAKQ